MMHRTHGTCRNRFPILPLRASAALVAFILMSAEGLAAQEPPDRPPEGWGPVSVNLEDVPYPHPVSFVEFALYGETVRMAYMDVRPAGEGDDGVVVLLHGGNYWAASWERTIDDLVTAGFRVVAMDQIGYGRSSKPLIPYSLDMHAGNIARVLDHLEVERAAVVGHSYGGMKASRFALLYPERTTHVALVNAIGLSDARTGRGWVPVAPAPDRSYAAALSTIRGHVARWDDRYLEYVRIHYGWGLSGEWPRLAAVRAFNSEVIRTTTVVHDWPQIEAPALVIGGGAGRTPIPRAGPRRRRGLPQRARRPFPRGGAQSPLGGAGAFESGAGGVSAGGGGVRGAPPYPTPRTRGRSPPPPSPPPDRSGAAGRAPH